MKPSLLASYCLVMTAAWTFFFSQVKSHYERPDHLHQRIDLLHDKVDQEKLSHLFTKYQFEDFRQYVGTLLPGVIEEKGQGEASYPYRTLASVVQKQPNENLQVVSANKIFEQGKKYFRDGRYNLAIKYFSQVISEHAYSAHVPESFFLKLESHYQLREFSQALNAYESLLDLYPSNELTGYAMIRVGKIYEFENRFDDAVSIYRNVLSAFPQRDIASLARKHLKASGL